MTIGCVSKPQAAPGSISSSHLTCSRVVRAISASPSGHSERPSGDDSQAVRLRFAEAALSAISKRKSTDFFSAHRSFVLSPLGNVALHLWQTHSRYAPEPVLSVFGLSCVTDACRCLQAEGNKAFSAKQYDQAIKHFSDAINLDSSNHVLYSNRSASHVGTLSIIVSARCRLDACPLLSFSLNRSQRL